MHKTLFFQKWRNLVTLVGLNFRVSGLTEELINKKASERKFSKDLLFSFTKINHFVQSFREEERRRRKKTFCKSIGSLDLRRMGIFS